eukprot:9618952-Alexandrium_andersonii.AAC.1
MREAAAAAPSPLSAVAFTAAGTAAAATLDHHAALWRLAACALAAFQGARAGIEQPDASRAGGSR